MYIQMYVFVLLTLKYTLLHSVGPYLSKFVLRNFEPLLRKYLK